jgi:hypothetical protein
MRRRPGAAGHAALQQRIYGEMLVSIKGNCAMQHDPPAAAKNLAATLCRTTPGFARPTRSGIVLLRPGERRSVTRLFRQSLGSKAASPALTKNLDMESTTF